MRTHHQRARWRQAAQAAANRPNLTRAIAALPPEPEPPLHGTSPIEALRQAAPPKCDRSGDIGSKHYWPEGAQVGDLCLCGKRAKLKPPPPL